MKLSRSRKYSIYTNMLNKRQGHFIFTSDFQDTIIGCNRIQNKDVSKFTTMLGTYILYIAKDK